MCGVTLEDTNMLGVQSVQGLLKCRQDVFKRTSFNLNHFCLETFERLVLDHTDLVYEAPIQLFFD